MTPEEALERVSKFEQRISEIANAGQSSDYKVQWRILENDVEEFNTKAFVEGSADFDKLHAVLHPMAFGVGGDPWRSFLGDAKYLLETLQLIEHRLKQGQSVMKGPTGGEILIEPDKPHSAYAKLRDLVESATNDLLIVDPYVDRTLFDLLSNTKPGVSVRILTRTSNLPGDFVLEAGKFKQQKGAHLAVRAGLTDFHDRFLIVDDCLFTSGASFKDLGKKGSVVTEITEIKDQAVPLLEDRWTAATPLA